MSDQESVENKARVVFTGLAVLLLVGWLLFMAVVSGNAPDRDSDGNVIFDQFDRLEGILPVMVALVGTAFGYWFGVHGKAGADEQAATARALAETSLAAADTARTQADEARQEAEAAKGDAARHRDFVVGLHEQHPTVRPLLQDFLGETTF